jgi:hypothetical protein
MEILVSRSAPFIYLNLSGLTTIVFDLQDRLRHVNDLSPPGAASLTAQEPTLVTSLHWLHSGDDAGCLLVTYLYQGIT